MQKKCSNIHIGNKASKEACPKLKIHDDKMKLSEIEKYLGDYVTKNFKSEDTIKARISRLCNHIRNGGNS